MVVDLPFGISDEDEKKIFEQRKRIVSKMSAQRSSRVFRQPRPVVNDVNTCAETTVRAAERIINTTNTIDIPKALVEDIQSIVKTESSVLSDIVLKEGLGILLAYRHALVYTTVLAREGLQVDVGDSDTEIDELFGDIVKLRVVEYMLKKVKISTVYKERILNKIIHKMFTADRKKVAISSNYDVVGVVK